MLLFASEYVSKVLAHGLVLDREGGTGSVSIPDSIAMRLFYAYFRTVQDGHCQSVIEFATEQEFFRILHAGQPLSELQVAELVLMKHLIHHMEFKPYDAMLQAMGEIEQLSGHLSSSENRRDVTINLETARGIIKEYQVASAKQSEGAKSYLGATIISHTERK